MLERRGQESSAAGARLPHASPHGRAAAPSTGLRTGREGLAGARGLACHTRALRAPCMGILWHTPHSLPTRARCCPQHRAATGREGLAGARGLACHTRAPCMGILWHTPHSLPTRARCCPQHRAATGREGLAGARGLACHARAQWMEIQWRTPHATAQHCTQANNACQPCTATLAATRASQPCLQGALSTPPPQAPARSSPGHCAGRRRPLLSAFTTIRLETLSFRTSLLSLCRTSYP